VQNILIDAGPLIALFDRDDAYHKKVLTFLEKFKGHLYTTWPVITETTHLLSFRTDVQISFLEWLKRDALNIINLEKIHLERIIELTKKYSNVPMDLADSSLIVVAEMTGMKEILTIDSDYYIYRLKGNKALKNALFD
jgi:uncharacterized protein